MSTIDNLRAAVAMVRGNPAAVAELDAAATAQAKAAAAEAKHRADLVAKVEHGIAAHADELLADLYARRKAADRGACERLSRAHLEQAYGLVPLQVQASNPAPMRVSEAAVEAEMKRLSGTAPIPWDRAGRSAAQIQSETAGAAAAELARPARERAEAAARLATERAESAARERAEAMAARKAQAKHPAVK